MEITFRCQNFHSSSLHLVILYAKLVGVDNYPHDYSDRITMMSSFKKHILRLFWNTHGCHITRNSTFLAQKAPWKICFFLQFFVKFVNRNEIKYLWFTSYITKHISCHIAMELRSSRCSRRSCQNISLRSFCSAKL